MKKIAGIVLLLLALCIAAAYIFIPSEIKVAVGTKVACIPKNITDCLQDEGRWTQWWPEHSSSISRVNDFYIYKDVGYKLNIPFTDGAEIDMDRQGEKIKTRLLLIPSGKDSTLVEWEATLAAGSNPFKRVSEYFEANEINHNMQFVLDSLVNFADKTENIYGFPIQRTTFTDTTLFATRFSSASYPSVEMIYQHIDELKKKIAAAGAVEKDFPMLNVNRKDSAHYETMIAICVNKSIAGDKNFFTSNMVPMRDRFLRTELTGGPSSIQNAHKAVERYMVDHYVSAPAIPFEILVSDRSREADTAKWKTIIFYPSM